MKRVVIVAFIALIVTSCFPYDKQPQLKIRLDKTIAAEASEICLTDSLGIVQADKCLPVQYGQLNYHLAIRDYKTRIGMVIKFKNGNPPDFQLLLTSSYAVQIQKAGNKITAEPMKRSKTIWYLSIGLIAFIVILLTKIPFALLILWPKDKLRFLGRWIISNLLYLTFFILLFSLLGNGNYKYLVLYYGLVLIADFALLEYWYKRESKTLKIALSALISNLIFLTAGQLAITFIMMYLS